MARTYNCPFCDIKFKSVPDLENHVQSTHEHLVPKEYKGNIKRYLHDYRNGPGHCQICGAPTEWDEKKGRYKILCEPITLKRFAKDPFRVSKTFIKNRGNSCSDMMRKQYLENIKRTRGTDNLMGDSEYQEMLLKNRRIARQVKYKGKEYTVIGSYEERFVKVCDKTLSDPDDLEAPGPKIKYNDYNNVEKITITDFFIKSINCVVSIKDGGDDKNNHPSMKERRRDDAHKFKGVVDNTKYNVIELNGTKQIDDFPNIYKKIKQSKERYILYPDYYSDYFFGH